MSARPAAGWYADPRSVGQLRYWDGSAWTEHTQEAPQPAAAQEVAQEVAEPPPEQVPESPATETEKGEEPAGEPFTAGGGVSDLLVLAEAGFEPLGLLVGSSADDIGLHDQGPAGSEEIAELSQAMRAARERALTQIEAEADRLGADGIVGVRLDVRRYDWGRSLADFVATGTAVKRRDGESQRAPSGRPFTTELAGEDLSRLLRSGHRPVALVLGSCVHHFAHKGLRRMLKGAGAGAELPGHGEALQRARELALERMRGEARQAGADGVVGVRLEESVHGWEPHVIEFLAVGSAVVAASLSPGDR